MASYRTVAFVTANTRDFAEAGCDPPRLNDSLADEVALAANGIGVVSLFTELRELIPQLEVLLEQSAVRDEQHAGTVPPPTTPDTESVDGAHSLGAELLDDGFYSLIRARLRDELLDRVGSHVDWPEGSPLSDSQVFDTELVHASDIVEVELEHASLLDNGLLLLVFDAHFDAIVGALVDRQHLAGVSPRMLDALHVSFDEVDSERPPTAFWEAPAGVGVDVCTSSQARAHSSQWISVTSLRSSHRPERWAPGALPRPDGCLAPRVLPQSPLRVARQGFWVRELVRL